MERGMGEIVMQGETGGEIWMEIRRTWGIISYFLISNLYSVTFLFPGLMLNTL